jgi:hypothetical protein
MKNLLIILIVLFAAGCDNKIIAKFEITNQTEEQLDSVFVKTADNTQLLDYISLKKNETKTYFLDMTNLPKVDGDYILSYNVTNDETSKQVRFGYYTNGYPEEEVTYLEIKTDTVVINQVFKKY